MDDKGNVCVRGIKESRNMSSCAFVIYYTLTHKDSILSELNRMGCTIVGHTDSTNAVAVFLNEKQVALVKELDGVKKIWLDNCKGELKSVF